jgi:DNA-binding MarR family transcriptional regulator
LKPKQTNKQKVHNAIYYFTPQQPVEIAEFTKVPQPSTRRIIRELVAAGLVKPSAYGGYVRAL